MKNLRILLALSIMVSSTIFISSCKKEAANTPPVANFTFTGDNNPAPCVVSFTNSSTNATSYIWDFGDGTQTSTDQNPQHTYSTGATFTVQLTATGAGGSNSITKKVTIKYTVPIANFTFTGDNNPAPCVVSFTNSSTNATSYIWDFGDGTQTSTDQNPQHTYTTGGTFTVQLTVTGAGGSNSITKSVIIQNPVSGTNITFNNPIFTNIYVTLNGTTQTILPGSSVTFYSVPGSSVSYLAHTYGTATDGTQIGIRLDWGYTINLPGGNISYTLIYTSTVFFLYMKNVGTHTLTPLYVNYGLSQQTEDRILIPNDNVKYSTGYYYAFSNTVVRAYYQDNPTWYTYWQNINFPWTDNQSIELINTFKKSASIDETHTSVVNPQLLKPAGNLKLNSKFDKKAINVYCK